MSQVTHVQGALDGRPFHQRATEMVVQPLSPAAVGRILRLPAAEAFDAYLVSGGLPLVLEEWPTGVAVHEYLADAVRDPTSALLVSAERSLAAEFPTEVQARQVLTAVGSGERTFSLIGRAAGGLADLAELVAHRSRLPGAEPDVPLLAVTRSGSTAPGVRVVEPEELIGAWVAR